jgi:hypothetical protein
LGEVSFSFGDVYPFTPYGGDLLTAFNLFGDTVSYRSGDVEGDLP